MKRIIVVGGGMTGLACAWALRGRADVTVLEASDRIGGNVLTVNEGGFVMDAGPDGWLTSKPAAGELAREVGLEGETVETLRENRRVYIAHESRLFPIPEGMVLGIPTRIAPMVTTRLFSMRGKLRMGLEPFIPRRRSDEDESVVDFVTRRLGREASDRLAAPLLGGVFAGDASELSVQAAFPQLAQAEKRYGSLVRAMRATRRGATGSAFTSLARGMGSFPEALARGLDVATSTRVERISSGPKLEVVTSSGALSCDALVLAVGPRAAQKLLADVDRDASAIVGDIACGSSAAIFLGYRRADVAHPLDATGFVVAREPNRKLVACTFVSSKWPSRAPADHVLLRAFISGANFGADDASLIATARTELGALLGHLGDPVLTRVFRHTSASPQPTVGHLDRMAMLTRRLAITPNLHIIGNGYAGTGIPDCISQALTLATRLTAG